MTQNFKLNIKPCNPIKSQNQILSSKLIKLMNHQIQKELTTKYHLWSWKTILTNQTIGLNKTPKWINKVFIAVNSILHMFYFFPLPLVMEVQFQRLISERESKRCNEVQINSVHPYNEVQINNVRPDNEVQINNVHPYTCNGIF